MLNAHYKKPGVHCAAQQSVNKKKYDDQKDLSI